MAVIVGKEDRLETSITLADFLSNSLLMDVLNCLLLDINGNVVVVIVDDGLRLLLRDDIIAPQ